MTLKLYNEQKIVHTKTHSSVSMFLCNSRPFLSPESEAMIQDEKLQVLLSQKQFVENWLADLLDSIDKNPDRETQERIVSNCGKTEIHLTET